MIQNSLSPVVASRISSFTGNTMSVENRILAWMGIISVSAYLTVRAPESAWTAGVRAKSTARATNKTYGKAKRGILINIGASCRKLRRDVFRGFLFPVGRKEQTYKTNDAGRSDRDRQEKKCFPREYLLESTGKHGIPHPEHYPWQDHSSDDAWQAEIENAEPVSHDLAPARTSRPFSKPCFSKASARFRLSKGSFV